MEKSHMIITKNCSYIQLPKIVDGIDGCISVAESHKHVPFAIKRVYYIYNLGNENAIRGKHAHKTLEQVLFCVSGGFLLTLDDGINKQEVFLDQPDKGVYLGTYLWHTMTKFSKNCVLLVLASDFFSEADYIRDYDQFLEIIGKKK